METKFEKVDDDYMVEIPSEILDSAGIKIDDDIIIESGDGCLYIMPTRNVNSEKSNGSIGGE